MVSTHIGELNLPSLPEAARTAHIVPELTTLPLISIGRLCDAGCKVTFDVDSATVEYGGETVLTGPRDPKSRLYHFDLQPAATCFGATTGASPADLVAFSHATLFSPALSTLERAIAKGYVTGFPGLTNATLKRHPPQSIAMHKGHLDQERKNLRSTRNKARRGAKTSSSIPVTANDEDSFPTKSLLSARTHHCYAAVIEVPSHGQVHTDQTGRFPIPSSAGNNYVMVLYDYDSNSILAEPLKDRKANTILAAYKVLHARLCAAGCKPRLQRLDNECSDILKEFMSDQDIDFQLVPPGIHRRNAAERAIRTWKNHFIAGLCSTDPQCPFHLWDQFIPQAELTLNLLRGSRLNPKLSAWAQLNGPFDFNRTPLAPPGTRVVAHVKPEHRASWDPHGVDGWYVGPAFNSYRCYRIWITETRRERIVDTLSWLPSKLGMPIASGTDLIAAALNDIAEALKKPVPPGAAAMLTDSQAAKLKELTTIFAPSPPAPENPASPPESTPSLRVTTAESDKLKRLASIMAGAASLRVDGAITTPPNDPTDADPPRHVHFSLDCKPPGFETRPPISDTVYPKKRRKRRNRQRRKQGPAPKSHHQALLAIQHYARDDQVVHWNDTMEHLETEHFALHGSAVNPDTQQIADYRELSQCSDGKWWMQSNREEIGRLCSGLGKDSEMPTGTETMHFIDIKDIPKGRKATYLRIVCADRPEKSNPRRVRWTVGGDRIDYPGDCSTKTADLTTCKLLFNSVISTPKARFMTGDLKDFYLNTPMDRYEYMCIPVEVVPDDIMDLYNLHDKVHNGKLYVELRKGMYGLPQAGRIANDRLVKFLAPHGYAPVPLTHGLWRHNERDIVFTLVVDDFGVKYTRKEDAQHLMATLNKLYKCSEDWEGTRYCGLTIAWDYDKHTCDISMPGYIERALTRFEHPTPTRPQHSPHAWQKPQYGAKKQYAIPDDESPPLSPAERTRVQEVLGTLLFYARAVDGTLLAAVGTIATQQAKPTMNTNAAIKQLLNYCATHPNAVVRYTASDMQLWIDSDASYLSEAKARSRFAGHHILSDKLKDPKRCPKSTDPEPTPNGAVHIPCQILKEIVSAASEAETAGLYRNAQDAVPLITALNEMGHPQAPVPIATDNSTAAGFANDTIKQKRSKAMDMRYYWIRDRVRQGQFHVYWRKGKRNRADYFTKHHPSSHHQAIRSAYLHDPNPRNRNYFECLQDSDDQLENPTVQPRPATNCLTNAAAGEGVLIPGSPIPTRVRGHSDLSFPLHALRPHHSKHS